MTDTQDARLIQSAQERLVALRKLLAELGSVAVAYSGGVDSTFLSAVAHDVLGERTPHLRAISPVRGTSVGSAASSTS